MSVSLGELAYWLGKHPRTVRRWCEKGFVPGAYRTKGGHWRLKADLSEPLTPLIDAVKERVTGYARERDALEREAQRKLLKFCRRALEPTAFANLQQHWKLISRDCTLREILWRTEGIDPETREFDVAVKETPWAEPDLAEGTKAFEAISEHPEKTALHLAANELALHGQPVTVANLCHELCISRATFHRRYSKQQRQDAVAISRVRDGVTDEPESF